MRSLVQIFPKPYISAMHLFIVSLLRKMGAHPGLAKEPSIPFNIQKMDFLPNKAFHHQ